MGKENLSPPLKEIWSGQTKTRLGMLIDPPKQSPAVSKERSIEFAKCGGEVILIGGSGFIDEDIFQETVQAVLDAKTRFPVIIFPGHIGQIPKNPQGIAGVLNYQLILGEKGSDFDIAFPPRARVKLNEVLRQRGIPSISTLYILCGDPEASVSRVSGIYPVDLGQKGEPERVLNEVEKWLERKIDCVFLDAGSGAKKSVVPGVALSVRYLINKVSPETLLFVGGGIVEPEQAKAYKGVADCISVGTYFENNGVVNVDLFISAIQN